MNVSYVKGKMNLGRLLSTVSMPAGLTTEERALQFTYGYLPDVYNVHHILPKKFGGTDSIHNLAWIKKSDHVDLNRYLKALDCKFTEEHRPFLEKLTKEYGGHTLKDVQRLTIN